MFESSEFIVRVIYTKVVLARNAEEAEGKVWDEHPDADEVEVVDEQPLCEEHDERDER